MKRVVAFILLLTIPLGFLIGANQAVDALQDDVVITAHPVYGDPKRVEGVKFRTLTTCGYHMWWYTDYTPADSGVTETKFHFSQQGHGFFDREHSWSEFNLNTTNGMGMSTSGGHGMEFEEEGIGMLINEVAKKTLPGQEREETLLLEDYFDVYPLEYQVHIETKDYFIDEMHDTSRNAVDWYEEERHTAYEQWTTHFRFPVMPGDTMTISVWKDETGAIRNVDVNRRDTDSPAVSFSYVPTKAGMYFSPVFQYWDGAAIETGEYIYGYGLYYIPFKPLENVEGTPQWMTFDFSGLEMVYALQPSDRLVAMEESDDGRCLHLLTREEGAYVYCLFDTASRQLLSRTEIVQTSADAQWAFYPQQGLLYLLAGGKLALVRTGVDSQVEFVTQWPEEVDWVVPSAVRYDNGILYGAVLDWHENNAGVCMLACDENGLGYLGYYLSNLNGTGYNSAWVNLESVEFILE